VNAVRSLALAGNFQISSSGFLCSLALVHFRLSSSREGLENLLGGGAERSASERRFRAFVRVFCPAEITMVCFPFAGISCFRVLVSKVCVLMINCAIVGSTISRLRCLILLFVCTQRLSPAVLFVCGDNGG